MAQALYFIDGRIAQLPFLVNGWPPGAEVHVIDGLSSGWAQMAAVLAGRSGVDAVHVLAHGAPGLLLLGQGVLDQASLAADAAAINAIGQGLGAGADVLLYACDAGRGEAGQAFIAELARLTGADLAASTDATGASALGGNWRLEARTGTIEAEALGGGAGFQGLLDAFSGTAADDWLQGGTGDDTLDGGGGNDTLAGGLGDDTYLVDSSTDLVTELDGEGNDLVVSSIDNLSTLDQHVENLTLTGALAVYGIGNSLNNQIAGSEIANFLVGDAGDDTLLGGSGDDTLRGDAGNDTLLGGDGTDTAHYHLWSAPGGIVFDGSVLGSGATVDIADGEGGIDHLESIENFLVQATTGDDWVSGAEGADFLVGNSGHDTLLGAGGADLVYGSAGNDAIDGGDGDDSLDGGEGDDLLLGGSGNDRLSANAGAWVAGRDTLDGGDGDDFLQGGDDDDVLLGGAGADDLAGSTGHDQLEGGDGGDLLDGGAGDDSLMGGGGDDAFHAGDGQDHYSGGDGIDSIDFDSGHFAAPADTTGVWVDLASGVAVDNVGAIDTLDGIEKVYGSALDDTLLGDSSANLLMGHGGDDDLQGLEGHDTLDGGLGDDLLAGGAGDDSILAGEGRNQLSGGDGNDRLLGYDGSGDNQFDGGAGNDLLHGGTGHDSMAGGNGCDSLYGGAGNDTMDGGAIVDRINYTDYNFTSYFSATSGIDMNLATGVVSDGLGGTDLLSNINIVSGSAHDDRFYGGSEWVFQQFEGGAGNDTIDGGAITDTLNGSNGNRINYINATSAVTVNLAAGTATGGAGNDVFSNINQVRGSVHGDTLTGSDGTVLTEQFEGRAGNDTIDGAGGIDVVRYEFATIGVSVNLAQGTALDGQGGTDTLRHIEGVRGSSHDDLLVGGAAANGSGSTDGLEFFEGGAGNDSIDGGAGYDRVDYSTSVTGVNVALGGAGLGTAQDGWGGIDTLSSIEAARGSAFDDTLTGSDGVYESFEGREGNDRIDGGAGTDRADYRNARAGVTANLTLGTASDGYGGTDALARIEDLRGSRDFADRLTGNGGVNTLEGLGGNDTLDGAAGADLLRGGLGNDLFIVDSAADRVEEAAGEGTDTVWSAASHTLAANVENLWLTGALAINGTGNAGNNLLNGNAAANLLSGGTGNDTLAGGAGNDTYVVDSTADVVVEATVSATEIDTVSSSVSWALGANLERLVLTGSAAINGSGNALNNLITGNAAANVLSGGAGNDTLVGGTGNDSYYVDTTGDVIVEAGTLASEIDTVSASVSWTLGANLERLVLGGSGAINGSGNALNNLIVGNAAANVLAGAAGNDTLVGGAGNDTYVVDSIADVVSESTLSATEIDTVNASVSWTLGANLERLALTGGAAINGTGNALNNLIAGNAAANVLNGGLGRDTMVGGAGGDTYVVDNAGDVISETGTSSTETDTVSASLGWVLGAGLERLVLTGSAAIQGTGNALNNQITGNAAANTLRGGAGNDSLDGGAGNDTLHGGDGNDVLTGGLGADVFVFDAPVGSLRPDDRITDFDSRFDRMVLDHNAFTGIGAVGALQDHAWRDGTAAADTDDRVIYDAATGRLWYDADGSGAGGSILFATLAPNTHFGIEWVSIG